MVKMSNVKRSMITAVCIALCVVLPMAFHSIQNGGSIFCPMHIPVLLCGLICGAPFGVLCGIAGPVLSSLLTGMPPVPYLPSMIVELACYGLIAGLMMRTVHTKKVYADLYISLVTAMLGGRIIAGITKALIFAAGKYSIAAWASGYFATAMPGIVIQLALIPTIVFALEKARLIPARYPKAASVPAKASN
ncbi:MAG: ECF transporter S component [Oscillospiraceae bacterium]|jgi:thiamine transporter ThiT|nr:ECF transporter S component [Oscillospiraceae bacterium]